MNVKDDIVRWPSRYKQIPAPFAVVRCGDHFLVCTVTPKGDLIREVSAIHWNPFIVRRWAFEFAKKEVSKENEL